ncbi:hypothetical protein [Stutzerimonas azotifigens]|uniref:hypothetical protein n=1 Tax=Stutzerimonas azotifigens TaxID=291995 RepID=UPI00040A5E40|nr:hypothetical protein [Stutzerimonas azotifigens]
MELFVILALAVAVWFAGLCLNRLAERRHAQRLDAQDVAALQRDLEILQLLQKHRALGAQREAAALSQRQEIAARLDMLWSGRPALEDGLGDPAHWPEVKQAPSDFEKHCNAIEALLCDIHLVELQLSARGNLRAVRGLGEACRALEDLGRLRGLAVRAAQHERCPLDLQVRMRYLCQRIRDDAGNQGLGGLLEQLDRQLISAARIGLKPAECFALITPVIDERLQGIRQCLG